jgi:serine/threonine protein kinase
LELCKASLDQIFLGTNHPRKYKGPDLPHHSTVFLQLAEGLEYMHSKNFIHRDIKPRNVLISVDSTDDGQQQQITMKWADFGLSKSVFEREKLVEMLWGFSGIDGIVNWLAPELLKLLTSDEFQQQTTQNLQKRGTVKSDVYALALVFAYLILDGKHLYGWGEIDIPDNIIDGKQVNIASKLRIYI